MQGHPQNALLAAGLDGELLSDTIPLLPSMDAVEALNPEAPPFSPCLSELIDTEISTPLRHEVPLLATPTALTDVTVPAEDDVMLAAIPFPDMPSPPPADGAAGEDMQSTTGHDTSRPESDEEDFYIECDNHGCSYAGGNPHDYVPMIPVYRCTLCTYGVTVYRASVQGGAHRGHSRWLIADDT